MLFISTYIMVLLIPVVIFLSSNDLIISGE